MYLITISLLLFFNLFISIIDAEKPSRRFNLNKYNSLHGDCVCFPGGQPLIPELLDSELYGMERLVVYLYRVVNTNQIILHKPGPEKQILIPDIPFTEGDIIKVVTTDTVTSIFNNYSYKVPSKDHADPIGLNIGTIHNVSPKPSINEFPPLVSNPNEVLHPNIPSPIWKYLDRLVPSSPWSWYQTKQKLIDSQKFQQPNVYLNNGQLQPNYVEFNNPFEPNPVNSNPNIPLVITNTENIWEQNDKKYFGPVSPYLPNPAIKIQQPDVVKLLKHNEGQPAPRWPNANLSFDVWFSKQLELLHYPQLQQDIRPVNNDGLRKLVLKTLLDNHIHIGATGMMIGENGTPINLEHLELRPILIGDPVKIKTLQGNQQLKLPLTKPYFKGLLITFDNPPKILGVIPLGKTYVSSQEKIVQAPISASIKYNQTPSHFTSTGLNIHESFSEYVNIPLSRGISSNIWNPAFNDDWRRRSQEGPKPKNIETSISNNDDIIPKAEELGNSSKLAKMSKLPGLLKAKASLGIPETSMVPKVSPKSNPVSQSRNAYGQLEYNNNYNTPSSSSFEEYYQSSENSLNPKPYDSESLQLIQRPFNVNIGAYDASNGTKLTDKEFTGESDFHLTVTPLDQNLEIYSYSGVESSSPLLTTTAFSGKPYSSVIVTPLDGNSVIYSNSGADSGNPQLTVTKFTGKSNSPLIITPLDGNSQIYSNSAADSSNPRLTVTEFTGKPNSPLIISPLNGKPRINSNSNSGNPNLIVKPINYRSPLSSNQFLEPHNFSPKLITHPVNNKLDFNFNPGSSTQDDDIGHIGSSQLTVSPYSTKTDSNLNSDSNDNKSESTNWQQTTNSNQMPSIYHEIGGYKSPLPYSHLRRAENQVTTPPNDENPSWTSRKKNEVTTQQPPAPDPKKPTAQKIISNNLGNIQIQNEVVSDSGDLKNDQTRRSSTPFFQDVFNTFMQMVLHNLLTEGSEDAVQYEDETNVSDVNIHVNSSNNGDKTGVVEDIDGPDFRIIGGSAATSSGAPLSNKGRSGFRRG